MTALLRYQAALLLRSQRWIAPLVVYAAFVAVGVRPGDPALDSLGYAAAGLVPQTAWLVRICVTAEPPAARAVAAAAAGPVRVHAAALLTALAGALSAGAAGPPSPCSAETSTGTPRSGPPWPGRWASWCAPSRGRPWARCAAGRWYGGAGSRCWRAPWAPCWPGSRRPPRPAAR